MSTKKQVTIILDQATTAGFVAGLLEQNVTFSVKDYVSSSNSRAAPPAKPKRGSSYYNAKELFEWGTVRALRADPVVCNNSFTKEHAADVLEKAGYKRSSAGPVLSALSRGDILTITHKPIPGTKRKEKTYKLTPYGRTLLERNKS